MRDLLRFTSGLRPLNENKNFKILIKRMSSLTFWTAFITGLFVLIVFPYLCLSIIEYENNNWLTTISLWGLCIVVYGCVIGFCVLFFKQIYIGFPIYLFWDKEGHQHVRLVAPTHFNGSYYWTAKGEILESEDGQTTHPYPDTIDNSFFEIESPIFVINSANRKSRMNILNTKNTDWTLESYLTCFSQILLFVSDKNNAVQSEACVVAELVANFETFGHVHDQAMDTSKAAKIQEIEGIRDTLVSQLQESEEVCNKAGLFITQLWRLAKDWPKSSPYLRGVRKYCSDFLMGEVNRDHARDWSDLADKNEPLDGTLHFPQSKKATG